MKTFNERLRPRALGRRKTITVAAAGLCAGLCAVSVAQERSGAQPSIELHAGATYTDNVDLVSNLAKVSESYLLVGIVAGVETERPRIRTGLNGDIDYAYFDSDTIEDTPVGGITGGLTLVAVPEIFEWVFSDTYGSVRDDLLRSPSPLNQETLNVFETGPDVILPLGGRHTLNLSGRAEERHWEASNDLDGSRIYKSLGLMRRVSSTQTVGIVATTERVRYDVAGFEPYDVYQAYAHYARALASGDFLFDLGRTKLKSGDLEKDGPSVDISWTRNLGERSTLSVDMRRGFESAAEQFASVTPLLGLGGDAVLTQDPRVRTSFTVGYERGNRQNRIGFDVSLFRDRQTVEVNLDRDGKRAVVYGSYQVGPDWSIGSSFSWIDDSFLGINGSTSQRLFNLAGRRRLSQSIQLSIDYGHQDWGSDFSQEATENKLTFSLVWSVL
jgi:hypothetical protein